MRKRLVDSTTTEKTQAAPVTRRAFLRKTGFASLAGLAVVAAGDVLASPMANASTRQRQNLKRIGQMKSFDNPKDAPDGCIAYATCTYSPSHCGAPCTPTGVAYCFHCTATPCEGAGYYCLDHSPQTFYLCCS